MRSELRRAALSSSPEESRGLLSPAGAFFAAMRESWVAAAARSGGPVEHSLVLAGRRLRLSFAGSALEPAILPALSHLERADGRDTDVADAHVLLWDSASTAVARPSLPWHPRDLTAHGQVRGFNDARNRTLVSQEWDAISLWDAASRTIVVWVPDAHQVPWYESAAPLRTALHWWAAEPDRQLVHAGAVGADEGGVLLAGPGGSGKSTVALACATAGLGYVGDDYVLLSTEGNPVAFSIYSSAKVVHGDLDRMPLLRRAVVHAGDPEEEKAVMFLGGAQPSVRLRESVPIRAVVVPQIVRGCTRLRRSPASVVLRALAPSTIFQLPGAGRSALDAMVALVRRAPGYALELGRDASEVPDLIAALCQPEPHR